MSTLINKNISVVEKNVQIINRIITFLLRE